MARLFTLFLLALVPRLAFWFEWNHAFPLNLPVVDAATFDAEARGWSAGTWPGPAPYWQAPLYSHVLGLLYQVFGWSWPVARLLNALLGAGTCVMTYALARRRLSEGAARLAFGIVALYGPLLYFEGQLLRETLSTFLLLGAVVLQDSRLELDDARSLSSWRDRVSWLAAGLLYGLAVDARENALVILPIALVTAFVAPRTHPVSRRRTSAALLAAGFLLAVLPITWHNLRTSQAFVPISTSGGINFYLANNPRAEETLAIRPGRDWNALTARPWREAGLVEPAAQSSFFAREAMRWMTADPVGFLRGLAWKAARLFSAQEVKRNQDLYESRRGSRLLAALFWRLGPFGFPFGVVGPLAVAGFVLLARRHGLWARRNWLLWITIAYAAGIILFFPSARHRIPLVPLLAVAAAAAVSALRNRTERTLTGSIALATLLLSLAAGERTKDRPAEQAFLRGTALASWQRNSEAERELLRAVEFEPTHAEAWADLAVLAGSSGRLDVAHERVGRALRSDSTFAEAWSDLGSIEMAEGDTLRAIAAFEHALRLERDQVDACLGLARLQAARGSFEVALDRLEPALTAYPRRADLWLLRAGYLTQAGRRTEAVDAYRRHLALAPRSVEAWNNLGILLAVLGQRASAEQAFLRAIQLEPSHAAARANLERLRKGAR